MKIKLTTIILVCSHIMLVSQGNSPFSQFGPGDFYESNFQSNFAKSGIGASNYSSNTLNPLNPSSYSQLTLTTGEAGLYSSTNWVSTETKDDIINNTNLAVFGLGFPLGNNWGLALGLTPLSKQNYSNSFGDSLSDGSAVDYVYEGNGGLSEVFFGTGFEKNGFAFGVNGKYIFGRLNDISKVKYSSDEFKSVRFQNFSNVSGFSFNTGAQYKKSFNTNFYITYGVTYDLGSSLNTNNYLKANYFTSGEATKANGDLIDAEFHETEFIINTENEASKGILQMPSTLQSGVSIGKFEKWELSAEYKTRSLSNFSLNAATTQLGNSQGFIIGGNIIPNNKALGRSNYWKTINYNFGAKIGQTGIFIDNNELSEIGINIGLGMPLKKFKYQTETFGSSIYLSFGYLHRSNNNVNIQENFLNINASVVFNDKWFVKRKFN